MAELSKIVSQRLQTFTSLTDHPDPNLLSAFIERSLPKGERESVLKHLWACASCREVVSLSATQPEASVVSVAQSGSGWLSWPALRWGAAAACVVVVGAVLTLRQKPEPQPKAAMVAESMPAERKIPGATENPEVTTPAPSPVEMADARTGSPLADVVPGRAKDALAEPQDAQSEKLTNAPSSKGKTMLVGSARGGAALAGLAPRWTLSSDGTLERSLDSGASWQTIAVSNKTVFRALAANALDIWVGGSAGALFHSSNAGEHWTQVRPVAQGEALEDDIIGVEFTDPLHGKLTSATEEIWITADAGQTWHKQ
ncbi:MAG: YCF48-related protein [Terriglobales bacterium]